MVHGRAPAAAAKAFLVYFEPQKLSGFNYFVFLCRKNIRMNLSTTVLSGVFFKVCNPLKCTKLDEVIQQCDE